MTSYILLEKFLANQRYVPKLSQIYHHIYFKRIDGVYLASNDLMLSFMELPQHDEFVGRYKDKDLIKDPVSLEGVLTNDRLVLEKKSIQIFTEIGVTYTKKVNFLSVKAPMYDENKLVGLCGISLIIDNYSFTDFNDILRKIEIILQYNVVDETPIDLHGVTNKLKFKLTSRELECLHLYMRGHSLKNIANTLGLSNRTIEFYLENIKSKFGVNKRSELLPMAFNLYPELV